MTNKEVNAKIQSLGLKPTRRVGGKIIKWNPLEYLQPTNTKEN